MNMPLSDRETLPAMHISECLAEWTEEDPDKTVVLTEYETALLRDMCRHVREVAG